MILGNPLPQWTDRHHARIRMIAPQRAGPIPQRFMQHAMVARCVSHALVEHRNIVFVIVFEERFEIDLGA